MFMVKEKGLYMPKNLIVQEMKIVSQIALAMKHAVIMVVTLD